MVVGDGLGNVIAQTPMIRAATAIFKDVYVWMPRSAADVPTVLEDMPRVKGVSVAWQEEFDDPDAVLQVWLLKNFGKRIKSGNLKARYTSDNPLNKLRNEVVICFDVALQAGFRGMLPAPYVGYDPWPDRKTVATPLPIFGFSTGKRPTPRWRLKAYPPEYYADVVDIVARRIDSAVFVQVGNEHDALIPHRRVLDVRKQGTLRETVGLISECAAFCSNDTGLGWAASALGVPSVIVFGPTQPLKALPPWNAVAAKLDLACQPCQYRNRGRGMGRYLDGTQCRHECMRDLRPTIVAELLIKQYEGRFHEKS